MQQGTQEQRTDEMARGIERVPGLRLEQQQQRAQEQRIGEVARSAEWTRLHLDQQQREEANAAEVPQQPPVVPRFNPARLEVDKALIYIDEVETAYIDRPHIYKQFLDTLTEFECCALDTPGVLARIAQLFNGNPRLIDGFNQFLPRDHKASK